MPVTFGPTRFINVFPAGAKDEVNNLMNIRTEETVIGEDSPEWVIRGIAHRVREVHDKIYRSQPGDLPRGITGSRIGVVDAVELKAAFIFRDLTVREILNEIALRTDGKGWVYEFDQSQHRWSQHRWDVLWPADN